MAVLIILGIIGIIVTIFMLDRNKVRKEVTSQGGMKEKYQILLSHILADPDAKIKSLTTDNILIEFKLPHTYSTISILQTFRKVVIKWKAKNPLGEYNKQWEFLEYEDQNLMAETMRQDMEAIVEDGTDYDKLDIRIDEAIKNSDSADSLPF